MWKEGGIRMISGTLLHLSPSVGLPFAFNYANSEGKNWTNKYGKWSRGEGSHSRFLRNFDQIPNHFSTIEWRLETAQEQFAMHITINRLATWNSATRDFGKSSGRKESVEKQSRDEGWIESGCFKSGEPNRLLTLWEIIKGNNLIRFQIQFQCSTHRK